MTSARLASRLASLAAAVAVLTALGGTACSSGAGTPQRAIDPPPALSGSVRVGYLHHSTGGNVWAGGVSEAVAAWNTAHATDYAIGERSYPDTGGGYPWANYPYDYWNLWVAHQGASHDRGELNLDDLAQAYDVIVWKHCFPVSSVEPDDGAPSVSSPTQTIANYRLQYTALKARLHEFPEVRFVLWTGAALTAEQTTPEAAARARDFFAWVRGTWDEPGDNVYLWDFQALETEGGLYLAPAHAEGTDSHPNASFSAEVAPLVARRIVDVIEGRGDTGSLTGQ